MLLKIILKLERKLEELSGGPCSSCKYLILGRPEIPCSPTQKAECFRKYRLGREKLDRILLGGIR
jgi:hypothetical protein